MIHTYRVTENNDVIVDEKHVIKINDLLDYYAKECKAYDVIDYILENEEENLKDYLHTYQVVTYNNIFLLLQNRQNIV